MICDHLDSVNYISLYSVGFAYRNGFVHTCISGEW